MRISLQDDGTEFARQVATLRKILQEQTLETGQAKVSANMLLPCWVPYLTALRVELRDQVVPSQVMTGAAMLIANLAKTTVQSILDASPLVIGETIEAILMEACRIACESIAQEAEAPKPKLSVVPRPDPGAKEPATVLHMNPKRGN